MYTAFLLDPSTANQDALEDTDDNTVGCEYVTYVAGTQDFKMYDNIFDSFHYDIGHGKATHEGSRASEPVRDGYSGSPQNHGPVGDWERDTGASTSAWERPGQRGGYGY